MAAAAARRGLTAPTGEATTGLRPVLEVEARSAGPRSVEMLLFATAIVRLLLTTILALVSGFFVAARGLMPLDAGPILWTHSVCSPTLREVTTAGSRAVDSFDAAKRIWRTSGERVLMQLPRTSSGTPAAGRLVNSYTGG